MFSYNNVKVTLFFALIINIGITYNLESSILKKDNFEFNINGDKITQDDVATLPIWRILKSIKLEVKKKINDKDKINLQNEIINLLNNLSYIETFLKIFIPRLTLELKSSNLAEDKLSIIDEAINETLDLEDLKVLSDIRKEKDLLNKSVYASLNVMLLWCSDFLKKFLNYYNHMPQEKDAEHKKIIDLITKTIDEKIKVVGSLKNDKKIKKSDSEEIIKFLTKIKFEKIAINPIVKWILDIMIKQQNFVKKHMLKNNLFSSKTNIEMATKISMKHIAIKILQETFTSEEIKTLSKYSGTNLFNKLTTTINNKSKMIAANHILFNLFQKTKAYFD